MAPKACIKSRLSLSSSGFEPIGGNIMPTLINPDQMTTAETGEGWVDLSLAEPGITGTSAMVAHRWTLQPGVTGPERIHGDVDQLLYVIRGSGKAIVDGQVFALDHESILWLEPGETYHFVAGPDGLEILQGYAPGGAPGE
jgi:quercetin dioxygenase-like cupin family protein